MTKKIFSILTCILIVTLQKIIGKRMLRLLKYMFVLLVVVACGNDDGVSPQLERALYHFYTGKSYLQEQKYYDAMEEMLLAEQLCVETDNVVLKGQICYYKGELNPDSPNYRDNIKVIGDNDGKAVIRVTGDVSLADNWEIMPKLKSRGKGILGVMSEDTVKALQT